TAVCDDGRTSPIKVVRGLGGLLRASFIRRDEASSTSVEPRFRMLQTIHTYARERLVELGEEALQRRRHYDYFLSVAEAAQPHLYAGSDQQCWFERLEQDHGNFRSALGWAFEQPDGDLALRLAAALWRYWYRCGYLEEGLEALTAALDRPHDAALAELRRR